MSEISKWLNKDGTGHGTVVDGQEYGIRFTTPPEKLSIDELVDIAANVNLLQRDAAILVIKAELNRRRKV